MKRLNWGNIWTNARLALLAGGLVFLYSFTQKRNGAREIVRTEVQFADPAAHFITKEAVDKLLIEKNRAGRSTAKEDLDLNKLEQSIDANPMVSKSEVFVTIDGTLRAVVKQKTPIARVNGEGGSFYLDYEGGRMPLSEVNSARVPLVSGDMRFVDGKKLCELFRMIYNDDFLKKNIIGVRILPSGSLLMDNRNFDYIIEFGKTINMRRKFDNYKAFFQKAASDSSIVKYKAINLKFTQQVVCTK
jgi:cell division protein FtsQ